MDIGSLLLWYLMNDIIVTSRYFHELKYIFTFAIPFYLHLFNSSAYSSETIISNNNLFILTHCQ